MYLADVMDPNYKWGTYFDLSLSPPFYPYLYLCSHSLFLFHIICASSSPIGHNKQVSYAIRVNPHTQEQQNIISGLEVPTGTSIQGRTRSQTAANKVQPNTNPPSKSDRSLSHLPL